MLTCSQLAYADVYISINRIKRKPDRQIEIFSFPFCFIFFPFFCCCNPRKYFDGTVNAPSPVFQARRFAASRRLRQPTWPINCSFHQLYETFLSPLFPVDGKTFLFRRHGLSDRLSTNERSSFSLAFIYTRAGYLYIAIYIYIDVY